MKVVPLEWLSKGYNTIQYNCLFRAPIANNKSYSKALYIVQCTVTTILLSVVNLKKMSFQFDFEWSDRWRVTDGEWRQVDCSTRMDQQRQTLVDQMSWTCAELRSRLWQMIEDSISIRLLCTVWPRMTCSADMDGFNCCPEWFGIFRAAIDTLKIWRGTWFHDQFFSCAVSKAIWFSIRSLPTLLEPTSAFLSFNGFRGEPVFGLSGARAMTSF